MPNRIRNIIPREDNVHHGFQSKILRGNSRFTIIPKPTKRNGAFGTRQLRVVCRTCNMGWMREAEEDAFSIITDLILGQSKILSLNDCHNIALFCGILFCMIDLDDKKTSGISQEERTFIYNERRLPEFWTVHAGHVRSPDWHFGFKHHGAMASPSASFTRPDRFNAQICTAAIGQLLLHMHSAQGWHIVGDRVGYAALTGTVLINPSHGDVDWGALPIIDTERANRIADELAFHRLSRPM